MVSFTPARERDVLPDASVTNNAIESGAPSSREVNWNLGVLTLVILSDAEIPVSSSTSKSGSDAMTNGDVSTVKVIKLSTYRFASFKSKEVKAERLPA